MKKREAKIERNRIKRTTGELIFDGFNQFFMIGLIAITVYPFLYVLIASVSEPAQISAHRGLLLMPQGLQLQAYELVFQNRDVITGYLNTIFYVVVGTSFNILLTILTAFVLSRQELMLKNIIVFGIIFTMFFGGGMIPTYLMMSDLNLIGTRWAVIFPGLISTTNVIIMRTSFQALPRSLEESAKIDGASDFTVLFKIILPLSKAIIAVMVLFYGVGHWNSWFNAYIYLNERNLFPLQLVLREILVYSGTGDMLISLGDYNGQDMSEIIKYATIIVSTVPILCIYPFLQKYFVKGVMIGAIKG